MQMKRKPCDLLRTTPEFQIQINNKILFVILLHVDNVHNQHVGIMPLIKGLISNFTIPH